MPPSQEHTRVSAVAASCPQVEAANPDVATGVKVAPAWRYPIRDLGVASDPALAYKSPHATYPPVAELDSVAEVDDVLDNLQMELDDNREDFSMMFGIIAGAIAGAAFSPLFTVGFEFTQAVGVRYFAGLIIGLVGLFLATRKSGYVAPRLRARKRIYTEWRRKLLESSTPAANGRPLG